ncbi:hypothetical protein [Candidatus Frankia alpina]|uniref:Uncharacterized protein n=1 Tax=Candidatus Frankia alpina TaxID=2699483 RepID=A0A4S5BCH0_9ACTN|nr:hypothetical protein [Candidatus Frankia alpina]THJ29790.1 hypothetical protein E7Y31_22815 [Candidatus Frankia alpina]
MLAEQVPPHGEGHPEGHRQLDRHPGARGKSPLSRLAGPVSPRSASDVPNAASAAPIVTIARRSSARRSAGRAAGSPTVEPRPKIVVKAN